MKKTPLLLVIVSLVVSIAIPIIIYVHNFHEFLWSGDSADWGTFGDFIGGILNPVFAAFNVFLLIYISFEIAGNEDRRNLANADLEEKRNSANNEYQKKLVLSELKQNALKELITCKAQFYSTFFKNDFKLQNGYSITFLFKDEMEGLIDQYGFLFETIDTGKWKKDISTSCDELGDAIDLIYQESKKDGVDVQKLKIENLKAPMSKVAKTLHSYLFDVQQDVKNTWSDKKQ